MEKERPLALIIEDDDRLAFIIKQALSDANYDTEHVQDGRMAMAKLETVDPQIIILDLHLPHVSGKDILEEIRRIKRLKDTPVIVASADPLLAETLRNKADLVLIKPVSFTQLRELAARYHPENHHPSMHTR